MDELFEYLYGALVYPKRTFAKLAVKRPVWTAVLVFLGGSLISILAGYIDLPANFPGGLRGAIPAFAVAALLFTLLLWFAKVAVLHLTAELLGGHGSVKGLAAILGFAYLPIIFVAPAALLGRFLSNYISLPLHIAIYIWIFVLGVIGVRENYGISTGRAFVVVILPGVIILLSIIYAVVLLVTAMAPFLRGALGGMQGII